MPRVAWLTDIHLNHLPFERVELFLQEVSELDADLLFLTGDIGESLDVADYLRLLAEHSPGPVYFVLGNHDFYHGSIPLVRQQVARLAESDPRLHYLTAEILLSLTEDIAVVGHDGWADARLGDYERSMIRMTDFRLVQELAGRDKAERQHVLHGLGDEAATHLRAALPEALEGHRHIYVLTHVPPFREACWHNGQISDDEWAPHFTCAAMGQVLLETAETFGDRRITVLCGHTHGAGEAWLRPNLHVLTGGAVYGAPAVAKVFQLGDWAGFPTA